jgi:hypothetical protein
MAPTAQAGFGQKLLAAVGLVERRKLLEVALDAGREVRGVDVVLAVGLAAHELPLRLAPGPLALAVCLEPETFSQPRPLGADHNGDGAHEEHHREPSHPGDSSPLNQVPWTADTGSMSSPLYALTYLTLWAVLMRALLVRAMILPATCHRCGLRYERRQLGEPVCSCER